MDKIKLPKPPETVQANLKWAVSVVRRHNIFFFMYGLMTAGLLMDAGSTYYSICMSDYANIMVEMNPLIVYLSQTRGFIFSQAMINGIWLMVSAILYSIVVLFERVFKIEDNRKFRIFAGIMVLFIFSMQYSGVLVNNMVHIFNMEAGQVVIEPPAEYPIESEYMGVQTNGSMQVVAAVFNSYRQDFCRLW